MLVYLPINKVEQDMVFRNVTCEGLICDLEAFWDVVYIRFYGLWWEGKGLVPCWVYYKT